MKIEKRNGRYVIGAGKFTLKLAHGYSGQLRNGRERVRGKAGRSDLCPVMYSLFSDWLLITPRALPLTQTQWLSLRVMLADDALSILSPFAAGFVKFKEESFGVLNGAIVAVEYGD